MDALSTQIRFAMNAKSVLPVVEINTSSTRFTLTNVQISGIVHPVWPNRKKRHHASELEEVQLTFRGITLAWTGGKKKSETDDWDIGG